jgi:hypothetical protein
MHAITHDAAGNIKPQRGAAPALRLFTPLDVPLQQCVLLGAAKGCRARRCRGCPPWWQDLLAEALQLPRSPAAHLYRQ